ncbi:hypothetical protein RRG08_040134 [Elysia crispata]|uniref:Uncharacterized protein n=1 Tax=Elysia crispata TaxID=231223 RepID=A0AAE0XVY3_9GAST|nr:hypothetical protein RRG08_040134 [Elysia crispata]
MKGRMQNLYPLHPQPRIASMANCREIYVACSARVVDHIIIVSLRGSAITAMLVFAVTGPSAVGRGHKTGPSLLSITGAGYRKTLIRDNTDKISNKIPQWVLERLKVNFPRERKA